MNNILERQRTAHEEIELLEVAIAQQLMENCRGQRNRLANEHSIKHLLDRSADKSAELSAMYDDKDGLRQLEIDRLSERNVEPDKFFVEFYKQLTQVKEHHKKKTEPVKPIEADIEQLTEEFKERTKEDFDTLFSGEEGYGRFFDLNPLYTKYVNLKDVKERKKMLSYLQYLAIFDKFATDHYPKSMKSSNEYKTYLDDFITYLVDFFHRSKPLIDLNELETNARKEFDSQWAEGKVPGWEDVALAYSDTSLFCTACQKQFTNKSVYDAHLKGKKHIKAQQRLDEDGSAPVAADKNNTSADDKRKATAWKEKLISTYARAVPSIREDTRANVERKQALTDGERLQEQEQEEYEPVDELSDDEEGDDKIYNPLNLPIGHDGKPIPYWLYKLHGLGVEYPCEICGDFVYMGRKAYSKHFQEWRHAQGMRYLGIPNTKQFQDIPEIAQARQLYEKLKKDSDEAQRKAEEMEEMEDENGNAYDGKTYKIMKRMGLLQ